MILELAIAILAVYRVALMVSSEKGPFAIFEGLRGAVAKAFPPKNGKQHWLDVGMNCVYCQSFYWGFAFAWLVRPGDIPTYVATALALSGGAILVHRYGSF